MTLNEFINSDYFHGFEHDYFNTNIHFDLPLKRVNEIFDAREDGCDGRSHGEILDFQCHAIYCAWKDDEITENEYDSLFKEISKCIDWHEKNGSLDQKI